MRQQRRQNQPRMFPGLLLFLTTILSAVFVVNADWTAIKQELDIVLSKLPKELPKIPDWDPIPRQSPDARREDVPVPNNPGIKNLSALVTEVQMARGEAVDIVLGHYNPADGGGNCNALFYGSYLAIGPALKSQLTLAEMVFIIGHELGHQKGPSQFVADNEGILYLESWLRYRGISGDVGTIASSSYRKVLACMGHSPRGEDIARIENMERGGGTVAYGLAGSVCSTYKVPAR